MSTTTGKLLPLLTLTTYKITMPSNTSLILIGVVLVVLIVVIVGGVLYMRKRKRAIPGDTDTFLLPRIPDKDAAAFFRQHGMPSVASTMSASASTPIYRSVPSTPPETPAPTPVQPSVRMPDGYTSQGTPLKSSLSPTPSSSFDRLPDTPRPHPQVNSPVHSRQQQSRQDAMLEAMIRQAQRGIFITPGKDDLS